MRLSILDQSPIIRGHAPAQAIHETIRLARAADALGYSRYWLAEHHAIAALGDPCPEILLTRIAQETTRIRVGTGGILLPYYSPLKVAEQFRMLEALYPGRMDLGVGRAPGGDRLTTMAMGGGDAERFPEQVQYLVGWLDDALPADHPLAGVKAQPPGPTTPEVWLLGSSDYSGALASQLGLRFAFAHFISADGGDFVMRDYKQRYQPSRREPEPHNLLCVSAICAETGEEAERLAASLDLRRLKMDYGVNEPPPVVRERLTAMQKEFEADELMVITITGDYESRLKSYELLAGAFNLS